MNITDDKMYHKVLVKLDLNLTEKLFNHAKENDMSLSGVIRQSLRKYLHPEDNKMGFKDKK